MKLRTWTGRLGLAVAALIFVAACGTTGGGGSATCTAAKAKTATSASDCGGMDALVAAAKAEGKLNIIAVPRTWANYGEIIDGFQAKYSIKITSDNPDGSSQQEVDAVKQLGTTSRAPDVLDVGMAVALANTTLFTPYKVQTWDDILTSQKEPTGLWFQDYGGFMSIGYDSKKVPELKNFNDLLGSSFRGKVALNGNPKQANAALNGVMMANLAVGGTLDDIKKGVDFFHNLKVAGNFSKTQATDSTVKNGTTPVVFDWDYLSAQHGKDVPSWKVFVPSGVALGGYYAQAISKTAPHPAAARLWEEYLYSDEGQNLWLKGLARLVRQAAMEKSGKVDAAALAKLPPISGTAQFLSPEQATAAKNYVVAHWDTAIA